MPRQLINLLNVIYTVADDIQPDISYILDQTIIEGVHAQPDFICSGTIDIYNKIYPHFQDIFMRVFTDQKDIFSYQELDSYLKVVHSLKDKLGVTNYEVQSWLLRSGLIGIVKEEVKIDKYNLSFCHVEFEYQLKGMLSLTNSSLIAVHPMMYQVLRTNVDMEKIVYPYSRDAEEKNLLGTLGVLCT